MEDKKQKNTNKEISIPLFIPLLIIIIFIIVFVNLSNSYSTVIASTNQGVAETNSQNELETEEIVEIEEEILPAPTNEVVEEIEETEQIVEPITNNETQNTTPKTATYTASNGEEYTSVGILNIPSKIRTNLIWQIICDLIFTFVAFGLLFISINFINLGEFRLFLILGYVTGFIAERKTLGKLFAKGYLNMYNKLRNLWIKIKNSKIGRFVFK